MTEKRKLATVLFADIAGYTSLMQTDEQQAMLVLQHFKESIEKISPLNHGVIIQYYGDGALLTFDSAKEGVACSIALQEVFIENKVPVRIGLHLGDVVFKNDNVFGDGVNIASRIESMATPGSVLFSKAIRNQLSNRSEFLLTSLGTFRFKNVEEPMEVFAAANEGLVVPTRKEAKAKGKLAKPKRPAWQRLTAAMILVAGFILAGYYFLSGESPQEPSENEFGVTNTIAVFPFDVKGNPDIAYLGEGIVDLISTQLDEIPTIRSVDPNLLISHLRSETLEVRNPEVLARICSGLGANKFILGSIIEVGDILNFSATKYSADGQKILTQTVKADQPSALAEKIDQLIQKLIAVELEESGYEMGSLAAMTSDNLESLKFYLQGEQARRNGRGGSTNFRKAVELDSTFALAWMRIGSAEASRWTEKDNYAFRQWAKYRGDMPRKWQDYYEAYITPGPDALDKYKRLIGRYGESSTFLNALAGYLYYAHIVFGASCLDAKPYYLRALEIDPGNLASLETLTKIAAIESDSAAIQRYLTMADSTHGYYGYMKLAELMFRDTVTDQQIRDYMEAYSDKIGWLYVTHQLPVNKTPRLELIRRLLDVRNDPLSEYAYQVIKYGTSGREKELYQLWKNGEVIQTFPIPTHYRCLAATLMGGDGFSPFSEHYDSLFLLTKDANTPWETYAAIKYALALDLPQEARALKDKLRRLGTDERTKKIVNYYDYSIRAVEARLAGDDDLALVHIDSAFQYVFALHWIERTVSRYDKTIMAANIYANKGDFKKAISFYNPHQFISGAALFRGYSTYQLSNWYEQIGELENALLKCILFLESYKHCDEKYQPWVEEVKARRERLISQLN